MTYIVSGGALNSTHSPDVTILSINPRRRHVEGIANVKKQVSDNADI